MATDKGASICRTFRKLADQRIPLEVYWREAYNYSIPIRGEAFSNQGTDPASKALSAKRKQSLIYDSTGEDSIRLLASSLISGLTPASSQWFQFTIPNAVEMNVPRDVKSWLQQSSETIFEMVHTSNYNAQAFEFFTDICIGGMCGLFIDMAPAGGYYFEHWSLTGLYCKETLNNSTIDTVYRTLTMTAQEAANKFGITNLPDTMQKDFADNPTATTEYEFIHTIRPRMKGGKQSSGKLTKQLPWESIYVHKESEQVVMESGFEEFPVVIPRWMKIPDTDYALGPFNTALPDVKTLNKIREMVLMNMEMAIAGTFVAKDDGVLNPNTTEIGPRSLIMAADVDNIKPLTTAGNFNLAQNEITILQDQIRRVMMSDQLAPAGVANETATAVTQRTQMIRMVLAPVYGRLQAEFLDPLLKRCFGLAFRAGILGQPPQALEQYGASFLPTYQSPIARAQKMETVNAIDQFNQRMMNMLQVNPSVGDWYDFDASLHIMADLLGVPVALIKDDKAVATIRAQKAQAQQQAAQQQVAAQQQGGNNGQQ
jgi:hypothetical protein